MMLAETLEQLLINPYFKHIFNKYFDNIDIMYTEQLFE